MKDDVKNLIIEICNRIDDMKLNDIEVLEFLNTLKNIIFEVQGKTNISNNQ